MTSSHSTVFSEAVLPEPRVLRGATATAMPAARLDGELRVRRGGVDVGHDARLVDPTLERAFEVAAARARAAAQSEGYAVGWADGLQAGSAFAAAEAARAEAVRQARQDSDAASVRFALRALAEAAASLEARAVAPATELRDAVLAAAVELAEALLGRELAVADSPGMDALRRALALVPVGRPVTARLHPGDAASVTAALAGIPDGERQELLGGRQVLVLPDPSVSPAGCIAECDATRIDAQLPSALARVREVLSA